jgi:electron transport complex protein RnfG
MNEAVQAGPATPSAAMVRTLGLVATLCGLIIVGAYQGTFSAVAANKKLALERAVFKVLPAAKTMVAYHALPNGVAPAGEGEAPPGSVKFYATYDEAGRLAGIAAEAAAKGYADIVRILYAYDPGCQCVIGIGVVSMRETPGIGDKIITDKKFLANFVALDVRLTQDLARLEHEVKTVKYGAKGNPWEVEAISGATITSRAVGKGINDSAGALLPRLVPHVEKLRSKAS